MAQSDIKHEVDVDNTFSAEDVRTIMKLAQCRPPLPDDFRIPKGAWNLLPKDVRDNFLAKRSKALEGQGVHASSTGTPSPTTTPIPKQYGHQANCALTQGEWGEVQDTSPSSDNSDEEGDDEEALNRVMRSYKATKNLNRFAGMSKTTSTTRDVHVHLDMAKVRALVSKLAQAEKSSL
jgi:hypothetical protein